MIGKIVLCDANVDCDFLNDLDKIKSICFAALRKGHCSIVGKDIFYQFKDDKKHKGNGITGVIIIKESHFHISTWPESSFVQLDLNTCGETTKALVTIGYLLHDLNAKKSSIEVKERGL